MQSFSVAGTRYPQSRGSAAGCSEPPTEDSDPFALIFTCADFLPPSETIFDQDARSLVSVSTHRHLAGPAVRASIDYLVAHLQLSLVVVLGHTGCSDVDGDVVDDWETIRARVISVGTELRHRCPALAGRIEDGRCAIVAAVRCDDGRVLVCRTFGDLG